MADVQIVHLGDSVRDTVTGLKGVVIGVCEYLYGCRRVIVQPPIDKAGKYVEAIWIDEPQVRVLVSAAVKASAKQRKLQPAGPRDEQRIRNAR